MKRIVRTSEAPQAVGAYSQATVSENLLFTAGQIPLTADGELLDDEPVKVQTRQCLENIASILDEAGAGMTDVLKTTVYLADIDDFDEMNDAYAEYFRDRPPARSAVGVAALPKDVAVEIEAIATTE